VNLANPHIRQAIATERIADLRRDATARPEETARTGRKRRFKRSAKPTQTAQVVGAPQR
jgi:hypothetical protein